MPESTPDIKVQAVRALGGHVQLVGESYSETQAFAQVRLGDRGSQAQLCHHRRAHCSCLLTRYLHAMLETLKDLLPCPASL